MQKIVKILYYDTNKEYEDIWTHNDMFIIKPHFDGYIQSNSIDIKYNKLIFSNYNNFICSIKEYYDDNYDQGGTFEFNMFNESVNDLPSQLVQIVFGYCFNQPVDNLPNKLTHLYFDWSFNQPIDNLPNLLTHLSLGLKFNHTIENLPNSLILLHISKCYKKSFDNLPKSCVLV